MPSTADVFAVGTEISGPGGEKYKLRPLTQYEQGEFQRWLEGRAHDAVDRSSAAEDAKDRRHAIIDRDAALGKYQWEGEFAVAAVVSPAGLAKVVELVCREQGVTGEKAEEIVRHSTLAVARHILQTAGREPGKVAAILEGLGLPTEWLRFEESSPSSKPCSTPPSDDPFPNLPG